MRTKITSGRAPEASALQYDLESFDSPRHPTRLGRMSSCPNWELAGTGDIFQVSSPSAPSSLPAVLCSKLSRLWPPG